MSLSYRLTYTRACAPHPPPFSGGCFQRQSRPEAARSFGQPRPISRLVRAGRSAISGLLLGAGDALGPDPLPRRAREGLEPRGALPAPAAAARLARGADRHAPAAVRTARGCDDSVTRRAMPRSVLERWPLAGATAGQPRLLGRSRRLRGWSLGSRGAPKPLSSP